MEHELPVDGIYAVDIVALDDAEEVVEDLDVLLDDLLAAKNLVGDAGLAEAVDQQVHVLEVLAEYSCVVQVVNPLDDPEHGQGLPFGSLRGADRNLSGVPPDRVQRGVLTVDEPERVDIVADRLWAAVCPCKILLGIVTVTL